jgi:hypothetical protein
METQTFIPMKEINIGFVLHAGSSQKLVMERCPNFRDQSMTAKRF